MEKREFNITIFKLAKDWHIKLDGVESFDSFHTLGKDIQYRNGQLARGTSYR